MANVIIYLGSPKVESESVSTQVALYFKEKYQAAHPNDDVKVVKVSDLEIPTFTGTILSGQPTEADMQVLAKRGERLAEFKWADKIVLASPMWDFSLPGFVKELLDCFCVVGETFKYLDAPDENGHIVKALTSGKKMLFIQATGGMHKGKPTDLGYPLVSTIFNFIGVADQTYVAAEGANMGIDAVGKAKNEIDQLVQNF